MSKGKSALSGVDITISGNGKSTTMSGEEFERRTANAGRQSQQGEDDQKAKAITIKSATLSDSFCNYSYEHEVAQNTTNTVNIKSGVLVHEDLKVAFKKLHPHLAVICEEIDANMVSDIETIEDFDKDQHQEGSLEHKVSHFSVSALKISGSGENEGVTLTGSKRLSTGEYVQLTTPKIKWDDVYAFINELKIAVDDVVYEVELYMGGKCAPKLVQTEMTFPEEEGEKYAEETL